MMSKDQENSVKVVYKALLENDYSRDWSDVDDRLYELEFLNDSELITESEIQIYKHSEGIVKCAEDHAQSVCLVPDMLESVGAIIELYQESDGELHIKNRYILQNYLAASFLKLIYTDLEA